MGLGLGLVAGVWVRVFGIGAWESCASAVRGPSPSPNPSPSPDAAPLQRPSRLEDATVARDESRCGGASSHQRGRRRIHLTREKVGVRWGAGEAEGEDGDRVYRICSRTTNGAAARPPDFGPMHTTHEHTCTCTCTSTSTCACTRTCICACICTRALLRSARRSSLPASSSGRHRTANGLAAEPAAAPSHRTWLE